MTKSIKKDIYEFFWWIIWASTGAIYIELNETILKIIWIKITPCCWRSGGPSFVLLLQEYVRSVNLDWMLGWTAFVFGIRKRKGTKPRMQLGWKEATPWLFHNHEQVFELTPKILLVELVAYKLVQSVGIFMKKKKTEETIRTNQRVNRQLKTRLQILNTK